MQTAKANLKETLYCPDCGYIGTRQCELSNGEVLDLAPENERSGAGEDLGGPTRSLGEPKAENSRGGRLARNRKTMVDRLAPKLRYP